jgi:hypothetical protein
VNEIKNNEIKEKNQKNDNNEIFIENVKFINDEIDDDNNNNTSFNEININDSTNDEIKNN